MGDLSTAGTTASTVIFRQDHIIVANVGDSTAVIGVCVCVCVCEGDNKSTASICRVSPFC